MAADPHMLDLHAKLLKRLRDRLQRLRTGPRHYNAGSDGALSVDVTDQMIKETEDDIALIERMDKHYRK